LLVLGPTRHPESRRRRFSRRKTMAVEAKRPPHSRIDWLISNLRWLLLVGVALVVFLDALVSSDGAVSVESLLPQIALLVFAILYNAAVVLLLSCSTASGVLPVLTLVLDTLLTISLILSTGGTNSPLLFFALFPILTASLRFSPPASLITGPAVVTSFALATLLVSPPAHWAETFSLIVFSLGLLLAAAVSSFISSEVRKLDARDQQQEIANERRKLHTAQEHSRLTFELASTLSATLDYNTVLQAVLEVGEKGMQELGRERPDQVGAVLLFSQNVLRLAASRNLRQADQQISFRGDEGTVGTALDSGEPLVIDRPELDPELSKLAGLRQCQQALVVPLRAGFESFGVVIFGNHEPDSYTDDLVNLLTAICNQATVALQNAQLYQDLREEKERIVTVEEDARKKLARSLHDGPIQNVASIAMQVNFVRTLVESGHSTEEVRRKLEAIEALARRTTKQIRHMLFTLRPLVLETRGLAAAVEQYVTKLIDAIDVPIAVTAERGCDVDLDRGAQGAIFYIIEEAISNARKHAQANMIWVRLFVDAQGAFIAEIEDDGQGFDENAVRTRYDQSGSLGLVNMEERADMAGGEVTIATARGAGTRLRVTVPLDEGS